MGYISPFSLFEGSSLSEELERDRKIFKLREELVYAEENNVDYVIRQKKIKKEREVAYDGYPFFSTHTSTSLTKMEVYYEDAVTTVSVCRVKEELRNYIDNE